MLSGRLIQVLDVLCHNWGGDCLPCFLNDQALAHLVLDTHLLGEHVHDDKHDDGEQHGVVLHLVYLKDDKLFIEQ